MKSYTIIEFYISQAKVNWHSEKESFADLSEAEAFRVENYDSKGFFWTGLYEYKIIERLGDKLNQCWACNAVHREYLKGAYSG